MALEPVIDRENQRVDFKVVEGPNVTGNPAEATTSRGDTKCLLCAQVVKAAQVHDAGRAGDMSAKLTAVVLEPSGKGGKRYRAPNEVDLEIFGESVGKLQELRSKYLNELSAIPDEPLAYHPQYMLVREYGLDEWGKLFNARQLLALTTFARLVREAHIEMLRIGLDAEYAQSVATYLGLAMSRYSAFACTVARWKVDAEAIVDAFARQAIPMVWDYTENAATSSSGGSFLAMSNRVADAIEAARAGESRATVVSRNATQSSLGAFGLVLTDPPYYDSINYADLSDFFYVWLKRSVGFLHPDLLGLPLTPKREQVVMNVYASNGPTKNRKEKARQHYVDGMEQAFASMEQSLEPGGSVGVVFAHTDSDAWATLIEGLLNVGLIPDASWPIDTELQNKVDGIGQARLSTSVWMACRRREASAGEAFLGDVLEAMRPVVRERLLYFWSKGIRGADFFISAIGPALSVFGQLPPRYCGPTETTVSVRDFLDIVRRESTDGGVRAGAARR